MLNLLPPQLKTKLRDKIFYQQINHVCGLSTLFFIAIGLLLGASYFLLSMTLVRTQEDILLTQINISGVDNLRQDLLKFNGQLARAQQLQSGHYNPLQLLSELAMLTPRDIKYSNIKLDFTAKTIELEGIALNRTALLNLQQDIQTSELFSDFNYPVGSLTEKENIAFVFEGKFSNSK